MRRGFSFTLAFAVVLVLVGLVYTVFVFDQDTRISSAISTEGQVRKAVVDTSKRLDEVPGIIRDTLIENQRWFKNDRDIEQTLNVKLSNYLGTRVETHILGGDWTKTRVLIRVYQFKTENGDVKVTVPVWTKVYQIEAPRPEELHEIYENYDPNKVCEEYVRVNFCEEDSDCYCYVEGNQTICIKYYETSKELEKSEYERYIRNRYDLGRVQPILETSGRTSCSSRSCGSCPTCSVDFIYKLRIYDPENIFINFYLPDKNGYIAFRCIR